MALVYSRNSTRSLFLRFQHEHLICALQEKQFQFQYYISNTTLCEWHKIVSIFFIFFTEQYVKGLPHSTKSMVNKFPSLEDILINFESIEELTEWPQEYQLFHHPMVIERTGLYHFVNEFNNAEDLIQWTLDNSLINNQQVLNNIESLLTCKWCKLRLESWEKLRRHERIHEGRTETYFFTDNRQMTSNSLTSSWYKTKMNSHNELLEHEELHRLIDELNDNNFDKVLTSTDSPKKHSYVDRQQYKSQLRYLYCYPANQFRRRSYRTSIRISPNGSENVLKKTWRPKRPIE